MLLPFPGVIPSVSPSNFLYSKPGIILVFRSTLNLSVLGSWQAWGSWRWLSVTQGKHSVFLAWEPNVTGSPLLVTILELLDQTLLGVVPGIVICKSWLLCWPQAGVW